MQLLQCRKDTEKGKRLCRQRPSQQLEMAHVDEGSERPLTHGTRQLERLMKGLPLLHLYVQLGQKRALRQLDERDALR